MARFFMRSSPWVAAGALAMVPATAAAQPAPKVELTPPASSPPPVAPPAAPPRPRAPKPPPGPVLPEPELRARVIAPSAVGPWTLRLENDGPRWLRVPADVRLLHFSIEDSEAVGRRRVVKTVKCALPAPMRLSTFPEPSALLLGPGDAYVEAFDPRLFCFGKEAKAIAGGALVRATYGWDGGLAPRKAEAPFAVEGTVFPPAVQPMKHVVVPSLVLSFQPPEGDGRDPLMVSEAGRAPNPSAAPAGEPGKAPNATEGDAPEQQEEAPPAAEPVVEPRPKAPIDENAARLELSVAPYADANNGRALAVTVTITNVGHRAALAAIRARMLSFNVDGPDGRVHCPHESRMNLPREAFQSIKPGGSTSVSVLVVELCGRELFPRPGLYSLTPTLHLDDAGTGIGLSAMTGRAHATHPMLVRIAEGAEPFYKRGPQAIRAPKPDGDSPDH